MSTDTIKADPPNMAPTEAAVAAAAERAMVAEIRTEQLQTETAKADALESAMGEQAATWQRTRSATPASEDPDAGLPKLAVLLRAREKAKETRDMAAQEATTIREKALADAKAEAERIVQEARARVDAEVKARLERLKTRPLEAIGEIGWDREQLVNEVAKAGTPEYQLMKRLEAKNEALEKKLAEYDSKFQGIDKERQEYTQRQAAQVRREAEQKFLATASADVAPNLRALYDDGEILQKAHATADRLRAEAGHEATFEEIRDYLEHEAKLRAAKLRGDQTAPTTTAAADATKKRATGPRSLSASATSERRATPKAAPTFASPTEEYEALKGIAEAAMKEAPAPEKKGV